MKHGSARTLVAAERVRQVAVDDAKRALSDSVYVCNAAQRKVDTLAAQAARAEAHALTLLLAPGILDVANIRAAQAFRGWQRRQLQTAREVLEREQRAEAEARSALSACLQARDAVRRLQSRRRLQEHELAARRVQHELDDLGALRAMVSKRTNSHLSGDHHGR